MTLAAYDDELVLVGEEIWLEVVDHVKNVEVTLEDQATDVNPPLPLTGVGAAVTPQEPETRVAHDTLPWAAPSQASDNPATTSSEPLDFVSTSGKVDFPFKVLFNAFLKGTYLEKHFKVTLKV
ncbi:hypothetical protein FRC10_009137 [Ceratobasidium sp. 414]|nr:hypothetical protein FRC10_009137 [Ceratobasidium sp. 414]